MDRATPAAPDERLWAIRKGGRNLDCELCDHGVWGAEIQVM
jgi:hypothetical protein